MPKELTAHTVLQWVTLASGAFNTRQICDELVIITPEGKNNLRVILHRLVESGVIARTAVDGTYRRIDNEKKAIDCVFRSKKATLSEQTGRPFGVK